MAVRRLAEPHLQPKEFAFTAENAAWAEGAEASWLAPPTDSAMARARRTRTRAGRIALWTAVMRGLQVFACET